MEEKVRAITELPFPKTIKKAMEVLGMFNYYRSFIKWFAWIAAPLYDGLKRPSDTADESKFDLKSRARMHGRRIFPDTRNTKSVRAPQKGPSLRSCPNP